MLEDKADNIKESLKAAEYFFFGVLAFIAICIAIMLMIYIPAAAGLIREHSETALLNDAMANASTVEADIDSRLTYLTSSAAEILEADLTDKEGIAALCSRIAENGDFRHVGFTDPDGITISSTGIEKNTSARAFIQSGLDGLISVSPNTNCDFDNDICDMYTVPVRKAGDEIIGVLSGDRVVRSVSSPSLAGTGEGERCNIIFDIDGKALYCVEKNDLGIRPGMSLPDMIDDDTVSKEVEFVFNTVSTNTFKEITINGRKYYAAFSSIDRTNWTFAAIVGADEAFLSLSKLIAFTVALVLMMSALLLVSVISVTVRIKHIKSTVDNAIDDGIAKMYVDSLTGHDTVEKFREYYAAEMKDTATGHALISLDVDRFKAVNDTFGYEGGNEMIRRLSDIIKRDIGKHDYFTRSVGDLFYILAQFSDSSELTELVERIINDVEYQITEIRLDLAVGIYIIDDYNVKSRVAADRADMARDSVKNMKQSRYSFFDNSMLQKIRREKRIEDIMEDALALREFLVYLQPKFGLGDENSVVGAEALVRWKHDGKLIPPGEFIPLFERNGFVMKIDYYMFEEVCKLQKKYKASGLEPKIISVNMSRLHIHKPGFVGELAAMCKKYDIDTKYFEIEITESAAFEDMEILCDIFREIKSYGFHVSIDDFGTGYSSLNMLKDLPVDVLKIDRSFLTENADEHENASVIIGSVVSLAAALGIRTICEGIETKEQAALLTMLGCNMAQGFYFARPMPVEDYEMLTYNMK